MLVSDKYRIVFVHIPKTGGTSVKRMMKRADPDCRQVGKTHGPITNNEFPDYFKFTVIRNSWELCSSGYRFEVGGVSEKRPKRDVGFSDWLLKDNESTPPFPVQLGYIADNDNNILVDKIINYDDLEQEIEEIKERMQVKKRKLKQSHYYGGYDWTTPYKDVPENIKLVEDVCKRDIEFFGFKYRGDLRHL